MRTKNHHVCAHQCVCDSECEAAMCGRCASSRDIQGVRHACAYRPRSGGGKAAKPTWHQCSKQQYYPSYNISPQANTPVLLSGHHPHILDYQKTLNLGHLTSPPEDRVLQTMQWGLIPSWHRGESPSSFGTVLNNCRRETMLEKPSFRNALEKGRRCVVVADGFFEWFRSKGQRQPYFIYFTDHTPYEEMMEVSAAERGSEEERREGEVMGEAGGAEKQKAGNEWVCPTGRMLTMAGLFDVWKSPNTREALYTYTVITVEAHPKFAEIHNRMPAVLDGQEVVRAWLDPAHSSRDVCDLLHPVDCLHWHPVSTVVNNSRNHTPNCVIPFDISKQTSGQKTTLMNWFSKTPLPTSDITPLRKRPKLQ